MISIELDDFAMISRADQDMAIGRSSEGIDNILQRRPKRFRRAVGSNLVDFGSACRAWEGWKNQRRNGRRRIGGLNLRAGLGASFRGERRIYLCRGRSALLGNKYRPRDRFVSNCCRIDIA